MAFEYFARARVEFGVFEVGLGGRLDATNILAPAVTIITRIDFDHENFLGHSLQEIAAEKAGILKRGVPVILADQFPEAREVIVRRAKTLGCPLSETSASYRVDGQPSRDGCARARVTELATRWEVEIAPHLAGGFQLQNALTSVAAARTLRERGFQISDEAIARGIATTEWPGRLEKVQSHPDVYLDGAHNPGAARELAKFWEENFTGRRIWLIYGALRDKAIDEIAGTLFPRTEEVIFTEPHTTRAISAAQLAEIADHHAPRSSVIPDSDEALEKTLARAAPADVIFITGSLYLVGEIRRGWKRRRQVAAR